MGKPTYNGDAVVIVRRGQTGRIPVGLLFVAGHPGRAVGCIEVFFLFWRASVVCDPMSKSAAGNRGYEKHPYLPALHNRLATARIAERTLQSLCLGSHVPAQRIPDIVPALAGKLIR